MSASSIVTGTLSALLGVGGLIVLRRVWGGYFTRRETRFRGQLRSRGELAYIWGPFGEATRRGLVRALVPLTFAWCGSVIGYWVPVAELTARPAGHPPHAPQLPPVTPLPSSPPPSSLYLL